MDKVDFAPRVPDLSMTVLRPRMSDMPQTAELAAPRQVARLAVGHYLDTAEILTQCLKVDLGAGVVFLSISRMNWLRLLQDQELALRYAGLHQIPPDDIRDPVSVYRLARELSLPYETVRRNVNVLVKLGHCARSDSGGVIVTQQFMTSDLAIEMGDRTLVLATKLVADLARCGISVPAAIALPGDIRNHVGRLSIRHFLGLAELMASQLQLDLMSGLVMLAIISANTKAIRENEALAANYSSMENIPPDAVREPVSVYTLAKRLSLPYETTRRYVLGLIEKGLCVRLASGGIVVPNHAQGAPGFLVALQAHNVATLDFVNELAAVGLSAELFAG